MNSFLQTRPDAAERQPLFLTTLTTPPHADMAGNGPEPCGLTPDEIRQIILELLG